MKTPEVKAAEEADRVQLVEALAEHPGTPWGEAIEKVAALRIGHEAQRAVIDGLRASLATVTRERDEARETAVEFHRRLTTRPLAVCAYCATPMPETDPTGARSEERMAWMDTHMRTCPEHPMSAVTRERDELLATLLNERGTGPTPDGWYFADGQWNRETNGGLLVIDRNSCPTSDDATCPWLPTTWTARWSNWCNDEPASREVTVIDTRDTARELFAIADAYAAALAESKS